jgi:ATP/maltotriose-dependent transcriptional regulator MalT
MAGQGRDEEALQCLQKAEELSSPNDVESQALWRCVRGPILSRRGEDAAAEETVSAAVELARRTEAIGLQAYALTEQSYVLNRAGKRELAESAIKEATELYAAKGNIVGKARCRALAGLE